MFRFLFSRSNNLLTDMIVTVGVGLAALYVTVNRPGKKTMKLLKFALFLFFILGTGLVSVVVSVYKHPRNALGLLALVLVLFVFSRLFT